MGASVGPGDAPRRADVTGRVRRELGERRGQGHAGTPVNRAPRSPDEWSAPPGHATPSAGSCRAGRCAPRPSFTELAPRPSACRVFHELSNRDARRAADDTARVKAPRSLAPLPVDEAL